MKLEVAIWRQALNWNYYQLMRFNFTIDEATEERFFYMEWEYDLWAFDDE